jgi:hypothetical protein
LIEPSRVRAAFATIKSDGSIMAWGNPYFGGKKAPTNSGYIEIYSNERAFAALKADGSITAWGSYSTVPDRIDIVSGAITDAPLDSGYIEIYSTSRLTHRL